MGGSEWSMIEAVQTPPSHWCVLSQSVFRPTESEPKLDKSGILGDSPVIKNLMDDRN